MSRYVDSLPTPVQVVGLALSDWWDDWVNMMVINLLWWFCWLTVVLGPPATFGMYYATNQLAHGSSLGPRGFFAGMRHYFFRSWQWMLINLAVGVIIAVDLFFYQEQSAGWAQLMRIVLIGLALLWLVIQFYAIPYLMEQEDKSMRIALRNALFTVLAAPGYTLVVSLIAGVIVVLSIGLIAPLFLGIPCLLASMGNRAILDRLETYEVRQREGQNHTQDDENMEEKNGRDSFA